MRQAFSSLLIILTLTLSTISIAQDSTYLQLAATIKGNISPKSIVHSGNGLFFAQNMMYKHKITVYDRNYKLVKTLSDEIDLENCGYEGYKGVFQGSPVEAAFSPKGDYMWVSNYQMYGEGFDNPGTDGCRIADSYDSSFIYKIKVSTFEIEAVVKVGAIPKYIAVTPDNKYVLVSNWCSGDLSIVSTTWQKEVRRIKLGKYPRGIVVDNESKTAYVAIMGETRIAVVDLKSYKVSWIEDVGKKPRHLCIDSKSKYLYATINSENKVRKIDLLSKEVVATARTQKTPRSMVLADNDKDLFVVNYNSNTMSHINTINMKTVQSVPTDHHPIGITYDHQTKDVWVACYSGSVKVYNQISYQTPVAAIPVHTNPENTIEQNEITETVPIEIPETTENESASISGRYHVIVGAFADPNNVQKMLKTCKNRGYSPYIINPGSRVQKISCHNYSSIQEARTALPAIQSSVEQGAWVLKK